MDWAVFAVAGLATLAGAFGVIVSSNPVHSALMLVMTLFGIAVLFVAQAAHFLAAVQVIVYAGAIVVLFLFVIMLLGIDRVENLGTEPLRGQRFAAGLAGLLGLVEVLLLARNQWATGAMSVAGPADGPGSNVEKLARSLFTRYLLAFEITSVLLVIAVVGAVVLARRTRQDDTASAAEAHADEAGPEGDALETVGGGPEGQSPSSAA
jgi:NADH-quinone oxidoreductase subunit J